MSIPDEAVHSSLLCALLLPEISGGGFLRNKKTDNTISKFHGGIKTLRNQHLFHHIERIL
jgi:hypothetical protein